MLFTEFVREVSSLLRTLGGTSFWELFRMLFTEFVREVSSLLRNPDG